ncbi:MAG TPA: hypothetical protein VMF59_14035, partial [Bacteroidota bacterium]|nr:hypothetical protein [Bacteroidota bacterium]
MLRSLLLPAIALLLVDAGGVRAQNPNEDPLTRDEVSVIKKKMVAALEALGQPEGYSIERDN